jgi:hypothetical protein
MIAGESTYKCVSCVKNLRSVRCDDTPVKTQSAAPVASSPVKVISPARALELPPIFDGDKYEAQLVQLETIRLNEQCAVDLLKLLLDLVHKLNEDVTHLKNDNTYLKLQLSELKESMGTQPRIIDHATAGSMSPQPILKNVPKKHPVTSAVVFSSLSVSSVPAAGTSADAGVLSYKDVVSADLPSATAVPADSDGFVPVSSKKKPTVDPAVNSIKPRHQPLFRVRNSATLPIVSKKERSKALFVSRFCPEVSADDVEKSLKEQLNLKKLTCTKLKTKYNTYSSFRVSVLEDEFMLINNTGVWPTGCLISPFYGRLTPDQVHSPSTPVIRDRALLNPRNRDCGGSPASSQSSRAFDKNGSNTKGDDEASGGSC